MEESAQRRERLKAMRMEASQEANTNDAQGSFSSCGLSNPLIETSSAQGHMGSCAPQRFDFYTDPMAAFSGTKRGRGSKVSPQISPDYSTPPTGMWNQDIITSTGHQPHINHTPVPGMQQPQYGNPAAMASPSPAFWNGSSGPPNCSFPSNSSSGGNFPSPDFIQGSSHNFNSGQGRGYQFSNSPRPGFGQEGNPSYHPGQPTGPRFNSPRFNSPTYSPRQGRGQWFNNNSSPGPNSGRGGRGRWSGQSGGGRGRGSNNHVTAEERPDLFYNKSMVEDPWKPLKPVIWKTIINIRAPSMNTVNSPYSWLPKSIATKRAKVEDGPSQTSSQPSLAEYLAASFNEATDHESTE